MPTLPRHSNLAIALVSGAGIFYAARRVAYAPADPGVTARANAAAHSGPWIHGHADLDGVRLHYAEMGSGPLVVLLHGFPQCWYAWRNVMPRLAQHFHVVAPDMRGYNESSKPSGVSSYNIEKVSADIVGLIGALGEEKAHIVGHDWGGSAAWYMGAHHANRINRLAVINAPHPAAFQRELRRSKQALRSWYVLAFQLPVIAEAVLRLTLRRSLLSSAPSPGTFNDEALDVYENAVSQPGAATAMLNYYRAAVRQAPSLMPQATLPISLPTLLIWGMKDFALVPELIEGLEPYVSNLHVERVEESGHWVPEEKPHLVADALVDFLSEGNNL
ncbi:MAG: alpha/beta fold hydrolase [Chloroflexia bacterium]